MAEDIDDPDIRAGKLQHELGSIIGNIANEFNYGNRESFSEEELLIYLSQLGGLIDFMRLHRRTA